MTDPTPRRLVPPLGWPPRFHADVVTPANRPPLISLNRYTRQIIGIGIRLPRDTTVPPEPNTGEQRGHRQLSIRWAKPARWWTS